MSKPTSPTYKTTKWTACNKALKRRGSLTIWLDPEMNWGCQTFRQEGQIADIQ
jgi:hypothetical protein